MAEHVLIDRYLRELESEVRWIRHAEDIIEEVADHLLESVAMQTRRGIGRAAAEQRALEAFGNPALVARTFASSLSGGIAVPTQFTRRAGVALLVSGFLWVLGLATLYLSDVIDRNQPWEGTPQAIYLVGTLVLLVAGVTFAVGVLGINRRSGGVSGLVGRFAFWLAIVAAITAQVAWAWGFWLTALGVAAVLLGISLSRSEVAPPMTGRLIAGGGAFAVVAAWAIQLASTEVVLGEGIFTVAIFLGIAVFSIGLVMAGMWLQNETPVDHPDSMATA